MSASKAPLANANWIVPVTIFGIILPLDRALADERNREDADLSSQHPEKVQQLRSKWQEWDRLNIAPLWGGDRTY